MNWPTLAEVNGALRGMFSGKEPKREPMSPEEVARLEALNLLSMRPEFAVAASFMRGMMLADADAMEQAKSMEEKQLYAGARWRTRVILDEIEGASQRLTAERSDNE